MAGIWASHLAERSLISDWRSKNNQQRWLACDLCDGEAESDGWVGEGHHGGDDGEPPELVEVWELRQQDLDAREDDHVRRVGRLAVGVVPPAVEAVGTLDRPASIHGSSRLSKVHIHRCSNIPVVSLKWSRVGLLRHHYYYYFLGQAWNSSPE